MAAPLPTPTGVVHFRCMHEVVESGQVGTAFDMAYTGGPPSTTDLAALASAVTAAWSTNLVGLLSADGLLAEVRATDLANPGTVEGVHTAAIAGTRSGQAPPFNVALVTVYHPNRRYRGSRPKGFWPFGVVGDIPGNESWSSSFLSAAVTAFNAFFGSLPGEVSGSTHLGDQVSVSYFHGSSVVTSPTTGRARNVPTPRATPLVEAITDVTLQSRLGSQRRRLTTA